MPITLIEDPNSDKLFNIVLNFQFNIENFDEINLRNVKFSYKINNDDQNYSLVFRNDFNYQIK